MVNIQHYQSKAHELNLLGLRLYMGLTLDKEEDQKIFTLGYQELVDIIQENLPTITPHRSTQNIWAVHPSCEEIDNQETPKQIKRLLDALRSSNGKYGRILITDAIDYILKDYTYVEQRVFEHVILTPYNGGEPIRNSELEAFKNSKQNLVGGAYMGMCLDVFVEVLEEFVPPWSIKVVKRWSYDPQHLTSEEKIYSAFYSLVPPFLKRKLSMPRSIDSIMTTFKF